MLILPVFTDVDMQVKIHMLKVHLLTQKKTFVIK